MSYQITSPQCFVQIFPYDGSSYSFPSDFKNLPNGGLLECTVTKNIHSVSPGTCELILSPGGPNGLVIGPSWGQIIVPLSLVVVTMLRGNNGNVVFVGVVHTVTENLDWTASSPTRETIVTCVDFQYFLTAYNFYTLSFLGSMGVSGGSSIPTSSFLTTNNIGLVNGSPLTVASEWLKVMFAILKDLGFQINSGNKKTLINFINLLVPVFQQFLMPNSPVSGPLIPMGFGNLGTTNSSWWSKFTEIFPFPMYELFLQTVPTRFMSDIFIHNYQDNPSSSGLPSYSSGTYPLALGNSLPYNLRMSYDNTPVTALVARKFPFPVPNLTGNAPYMDQWNKLPVFYPGQETGWELSTQASPYSTHVFQNIGSYISQTELSSVLHSSMTFSPDDIKNFFVVQPLFANSVMGDANGAFYAGYLYAMGADFNSIARYGYRPYIFETQWFGTGTHSTAVSNHAQFGPNYPYGILPPFFNYMISILAAYAEPTPWMAKGTVTDLLRPDILAGNRYIFAPFKDNPNELWMFYITETSHRFVFGGRSTTTLRLERGLPVSMYEGTGGGGLTPLNQLLQGQLVRRDGKYVSIVDSSGVVSSTKQTTLQIKNLTDIRAEFQQFFPFLFTGQFTTSPGKGQ